MNVYVSVCVCVCVQYVCVGACLCARVSSTYVVCVLVCYPFLPFLNRNASSLRACVRVNVYMSAYVACFVFRCEVKISVLS